MKLKVLLVLILISFQFSCSSTGQNSPSSSLLIIVEDQTGRSDFYKASLLLSGLNKPVRFKAAPPYALIQIPMEGSMTSHHYEFALSGSSVKGNAYSEFVSKDGMTTVLPLKILYEPGHTPKFIELNSDEISSFIEKNKDSDSFIEMPFYIE